MVVLNCAEGTLAAYSPSTQTPWNVQRSMHLHRRIMFGADPITIRESLSQSPAVYVRSIVDEAKSMPLTAEPEWAFWQLSDYSPIEDVRNAQIVDQIFSWATQWGKDMRNNGLRDRMSFFWHNHFVTRLDTYGCPSWLYQYHKVLQKNALGNFKEFVREIGLTPAMLLFLNGVQNFIGNTNENYARELYELFTLGVDNGYTQNDIAETARALTGWNGLDVDNLCGEVTFLGFTWDSGQKTIFGRTGNWGYDDVIDILFEERALEISEYICGKLYCHFVNPKKDEQIVGELATIFRDNDFELAPVLEAMFTSEHFFDSANIGTVIPGHIELFLSFMNEVGYEDNDEIIFAAMYAPSDFNQVVFNPVDVAGWPGNRTWINSSSLPFRWESILNIMGFYFQLNEQSLQELLDLALEIVGTDTDDPDLITRRIIDYFLPKGLQFEYEYEEAISVFKAEVPENYFEDGTWNLFWEYAPFQILILINHIANLPEFQLK